MPTGLYARTIGSRRRPNRDSGGDAQPTTAITVAIVDDVLDQVNERLAAPDPEQGGALLRPLNGRGVTQFEWDEAGATTIASYLPSQELVDRVGVLETTRDLVLAGVVHSHPNAMNRLSGPDRDVTRHLLQANRHLGWALMPIVTQLDDDTTLAPHELALPQGRLSCFLARLDENDDLHIARPAGVRVIPAQRTIDAIATELGWETNGRHDLTIANTSLVGCSFTPADSTATVWVLLSHDFPMAAPLVAMDHGDGMEPVAMPALATPSTPLAVAHLIESLRDTIPTEHTTPPEVEPERSPDPQREAK